MSQSSFPRPGWYPGARRRRAALLAAGLFAGAVAGAPLLAAGSAGAAEVEVVESGRQVTFSGGGLLGVSCAAEPSTGTVTVAAESTLRVVNRTGHRATLLLDGSARGEVAKGGTAEVLFHRGPVRLALKPHCVLAEQKSVRVQVVDPPPAAPPPAADPGQPTTTTGGRASAGASTGGTGSIGNTDGSPGRSGIGRAPATATGDVRRVTPDGGPDAGTDPLDDFDGAGTSVAESPPQVAAAPREGDDLAAEPLSSVEPISDEGPIGLLALIAIVCVLGASAGAIRAIVAQRASRASVALN